MNLAIVLVVVALPLLALGLCWGMRTGVGKRRLLDDQWRARYSDRDRGRRLRVASLVAPRAMPAAR